MIRNARVAQKVHVAEPPGPAQEVAYRQGVILYFNPVTGSNVVQIGSTEMRDLPLQGVADVASLVRGAVVSLLAIRSTQGLVTYTILGRLVRPNTTEYTDAITLVSQRIYSDTVADAETTTSITYADLGTPGPEVTAQIGVSGRALVLVTAAFQNTLADTTIRSANVVYAVSGATTVTPVDVSRGAYLQSKVGTSTGETGARFSAASLIDLNPGPNTFTVKYASGNGEVVGFSDRNITVFAL